MLLDVAHYDWMNSGRANIEVVAKHLVPPGMASYPALASLNAIPNFRAVLDCTRASYKSSTVLMK